MAKPREVIGLEPDRKLRPNARRILQARIDEVYSYDGLIADPANVTELHDMRIACKRLRYLLEIFGVAFREDLDPYLDEVKALQDLLGDIHDCDVQVPHLEEHLDWLADREGSATRRLVAERRHENEEIGQPIRGGARAREVAYREFASQLEHGRRSDERIGVHALIAQLRHRRVVLYGQFLQEWRRLKSTRFRARLHQALGIDGP